MTPMSFYMMQNYMSVFTSVSDNHKHPTNDKRPSGEKKKTLSRPNPHYAFYCFFCFFLKAYFIHHLNLFFFHRLSRLNILLKIFPSKP